MEITDFVTSKTVIPLAELTSLAANRAAFGDDVLAAFKTQIELRSTQAQAVLTDAETAGRDTLLASEQRSYDTAMRERDSILGLQRAVEQRTEARAFVPHTQVKTTETPATVSPVLTREMPMATWLEQRGHYAYQGESGIEGLSLGRMVIAEATGNRGRLSELERRVLAEGTGSAGGFTVPEPVATSFIDRVRNAMIVQAAGAQVVPMTSDTLHIARLAQPGIYTDGSPGGPGPQWKIENDPIAEGTLTLERVTFTARTLPILLRMSVELSEDSVNIDQIVEREMARGFAVELDRVALIGSGVAPEPTGILNQSGVTVNSTPFVISNYDFLIDQFARIWNANHVVNARAYAPAVAAELAKLKDTTNQPLMAPAAVTAVPEFRTNALAGSVVSGSPGDSVVIVGDFTQLLIGMRTSFRLEVSRVAANAFENLQIAVRAYLRADVQLAHPEAFDIVTVDV
jgi:HK97 family phage major capsid protein